MPSPVSAIVRESPGKLAGHLAVVGHLLEPTEIARRYPDTRLYNDHAK